MTSQGGTVAGRTGGMKEQKFKWGEEWEDRTEEIYTLRVFKNAI